MVADAYKKGTRRRMVVGKVTFARFCRRLCFAHRFYSVYLLLVDTPHMHCSGYVYVL